MSKRNSKEAVKERKIKSIRHGKHCVFELNIHLVFVPKYRRKIFTKKILIDLKEIFDSICLDYDASLVEFNGESDHVHLLINYPPKVAISKLVNSLKTVSSRKIRLIHPQIEKQLWKNKLWSPSYYVGSCGGAGIETVKKYIENQQIPKIYKTS